VAGSGRNLSSLTRNEHSPQATVAWCSPKCEVTHKDSAERLHLIRKQSAYCSTGCQWSGDPGPCVQSLYTRDTLDTRG